MHLVHKFKKYNKKKSITENIWVMIFVIIIGGVYNIVSNYESNINVPSNETIGSIANKTVVNLLR